MLRSGQVHGKMLLGSILSNKNETIKIKWSCVESKVADFFVFSHIRILGYFRLGYSRAEECSAGLKMAPHELRNTEQVY